jgi:hypothetical protein
MFIFDAGVAFWVGGNLLFFGWLAWPVAVGARSRGNQLLRFTTGRLRDRFLIDYSSGRRPIQLIIDSPKAKGSGLDCGEARHRCRCFQFSRQIT